MKCLPVVPTVWKPCLLHWGCVFLSFIEPSWSTTETSATTIHMSFAVVETNPPLPAQNLFGTFVTWQDIARVKTLLQDSAIISSTPRMEKSPFCCSNRPETFSRYSAMAFALFRCGSGSFERAKPEPETRTVGTILPGTGTGRTVLQKAALKVEPHVSA